MPCGFNGNMSWLPNGRDSGIHDHREEDIDLEMLFQDPEDVQDEGDQEEPVVLFPDHVPEDSQYRGFHVETVMDMLQVNLLLDTHDTIYDHYWEIALQQRGLVHQVEIYRREHEDLELAQLRQELDLLYQSPYWGPIEDSRRRGTRLENEIQMTNEMILWVYRIKLIACLITKKLQDPLDQLLDEDLTPEQKRDISLSVWHSIMDLMLQYNRIFRYPLIGLSKYMQMFISQMVMMLSYGDIKTLLVFIVLFPELVTHNIYPILDTQGFLFNPDTITPGDQYWEVYMRHQDLINEIYHY